MSNSKSSFASDLLQVKGIVERATPRTLVLMDEFGKGTLAFDGIALLGACISHYQNLDKEQRPKIFVSTHYTEIFDYHVVDQTKLRFWSMETLIEKKNDDCLEVTFLYKFYPFLWFFFLKFLRILNVFFL